MNAARSVRRHRTPTLPLAALLAALTSLATASCQDSSRGRDEGTRGFESDSGALPSPCGPLYCSHDLKRILKICEGAETVAETCGEGLGCGDGRCVSACQSAEISKGSLGCEFATIPPEDRRWNRGDCFAAMIANTWDRPVTITAELGAEPLDLSQSIYTAHKDGKKTTYTRVDGPLPAGEVAVVFLSQRDDLPTTGVPAPSFCPTEVKPAYSKNPVRHGTGVMRGFRLKTDAPVSAYSIFPYGGAPSQYPAATLLLPVSSWGTNYIAVSPDGISLEGQGSTSFANRVLQIVASDDETEVRMKPIADVSPGYRVEGSTVDSPVAWHLARGEVLQINQAKDLTGSSIESNKPIAIFGGQECMSVPVELGACDILHQQIPPLSQWGSEYVLAPPPPRKDGEATMAIPWSFVGAVAGTVLTYDPERPRGAPETLSPGQRVTFLTDAIASVKSQDSDHPFHASVYMPGAAYSGIGDPDFVNVVPTDQFLDRYVFFTDFTYADTTLTLVRKKGASGLAPLYVECAGEVEGWRPVGSLGQYEYTWLRLTSKHASRTFDGGRSCGYGRQVAESASAFAVTVWGTDVFASYGYPGGMSLRPLSQVSAPVN